MGGISIIIGMLSFIIIELTWKKKERKKEKKLLMIEYIVWVLEDALNKNGELNNILEICTQEAHTKKTW